MTNDLGFLGVRVSTETKAQLEKLAQGQGTSLNKFLCSVVESVAAANSDKPEPFPSPRQAPSSAVVAQPVQSSPSGAQNLPAQLSALEKLLAELEAQAEQVKRTGNFSFWDNKPDAETKSRLDLLDRQVRACNRRIRETKAALLGLNPDDLLEPEQLPARRSQSLFRARTRR